MLTDDFTGHYENDTVAPKLAVNVSDMVTAYDKCFNSVALKYQRPAINTELALKEITYMFSTEYDLLQSTDDFCSLLQCDDEQMEKSDEANELEYIGEVSTVLTHLVADFTKTINELKTMQMLSQKEMHCALQHASGEHLVYIFKQNDDF